MIKNFLFSFVSLLLIGAADAATPWWEQDTICQRSKSDCYANMGIGYLYDTMDSTSWDITSYCWGKKYICAEALKNSTANEPVPMGRAEIADTNRINADFDVTVLNGDCFGVRKTSSGGAMASVSGHFVKVWCNGILENPDEEQLPNGEITSGNQPTCSDLKKNGYVGIQNGKCYGKYYNPSEYYIQCDNDDTKLPVLVVLNGVDAENVITTNIETRSEADNLFRTMYRNSQTQHKIYFKD